DPMGAMQQIRLAQLRNVELLRSLQRTNVPGIQEMAPADALVKMIEKAVEVGERARKMGARPLMQPEIQGMIPFLGEAGVSRFLGPGGRKEADLVIESLKEIKKQGLTPEDALKWAQLYQAAQAFVTQIQTSLGTSLSGIAESMTKVSKGFTDLVAAFMN